MTKPQQETKEPVKGDIYAKLLAFQNLGISLSKDADNPHFKSRYADLNETLKKIKKPLNDLGVLIIQKPSIDGLTTVLRNVEDGTEVSAFLPWIDGATAQKRGSEITYYRRYSLKTILALDDDDDDGNKASEEPARKLTGKQKLESDFRKNADDFENDVPPFGDGSQEYEPVIKYKI